MISAALNHIAAQINQALIRAAGSNEARIVVSNLAAQDGALVEQTDNKLVLSLVNIEKDTGPVGGHRQSHDVEGRRQVDVRPPLFLNLYVMLAASHSGGTYPEGLKMLSSAAQFLQANPIFDHQNSPDLDPRIDRLALDIHNLGMEEISHIWGVLSGKYLPSILYKIRMVTIDADHVVAERPAVTTPTVATKSQAS